MALELEYIDLGSISYTPSSLEWLTIRAGVDAYGFTIEREYISGIAPLTFDKKDYDNVITSAYISVQYNF